MGSSVPSRTMALRGRRAAAKTTASEGHRTKTPVFTPRNGRAKVWEQAAFLANELPFYGMDAAAAEEHRARNADYRRRKITGGCLGMGQIELPDA